MIGSCYKKTVVKTVLVVPPRQNGPPMIMVLLDTKYLTLLYHKDTAQGSHRPFFLFAMSFGILMASIHRKNIQVCLYNMHKGTVKKKRFSVSFLDFTCVFMA